MQPLKPLVSSSSGGVLQPPFVAQMSPPNPPPPPPPYGGPPGSPYGGAPQPPYGGPSGPVQGADKKLAAGLCGIFLGAIGVHKFILGYTTEGLIMAAISLVSCGVASPLVALVGLIEGILYLTKTDQQFVQEYVVNKKGWF